MTVKSILLFSLLSTTAIAADDLQPNGHLVPEGDYCYTAKAGPKGKEQVMALVRQQVVRKGDKMEVLVHQHIVPRKMDMIDRFTLRAHDMTPNKLDHTMTGGQKVTLTYHMKGKEGHITGTRAGKKAGPVDVNFTGKIWEGNLWGTLYAALPLDQKTSYSIPMYQYDKNLFSMEISDVRTTTIDFQGADTPVYEVDVKASGRTVTYYIRQSDRLELGYAMPGFSQWLGGDCSKLKG